MKALIFIGLTIVLLLSGCAVQPVKTSHRKTLTARVTFYNAHEDKWGSRVACSTRMRAKEGETVAAHPDFPFFEHIEIPSLKGLVGNGIFRVEDRGSDVTRKKASRGTAYVFDVFLSGGQKHMRHLEKVAPQYMTVYYE